MFQYNLEYLKYIKSNGKFGLFPLLTQLNNYNVKTKIKSNISI